MNVLRRTDDRQDRELNRLIKYMRRSPEKTIRMYNALGVDIQLTFVGYNMTVLSRTKIVIETHEGMCSGMKYYSQTYRTNRRRAKKEAQKRIRQALLVRWNGYLN